MQLFYSTLIQDNYIILDEQDSQHCCKVLRMKAGDEVRVTDGVGALYKTTIIEANHKRTTLRIESVSHAEPPRCKIVVAVAPTKNIARFEWFLEKATEVGITTVIPIICERSERRELKIERLQKIIVSAAKQSLKVYLPHITEAVKFKDFINQDFSGFHKYIGWCETDKTQLLKNEYNQNQNVVIVIGPEGDFTPEEIKASETKGFHAVSFGNARLRTETAALIACHTINLLNE